MANGIWDVKQPAPQPTGFAKAPKMPATGRVYPTATPPAGAGSPGMGGWLPARGISNGWANQLNPGQPRAAAPAPAQPAPGFWLPRPPSYARPAPMPTQPVERVKPMPELGRPMAAISREQIDAEIQRQRQGMVAKPVDELRQAQQQIAPPTSSMALPNNAGERGPVPMRGIVNGLRNWR